jgi:hypothetical protein
LDGKPAAVHSYDYVEYVPLLGCMVVAGARGPYPGVAPYLTVDAVNAGGFWYRLPDVPSVNHPAAAVHPETGILWQHGGEGDGFLSSYDPLLNEWIPHGQWNTDFVPGPYRTAEIDPAMEMFVFMNVGQLSADDSVWVWDISGGHTAGTIKGTRLNMLGDTEILESSGAPGLAWHPGTERLYAWFGGVHVYEIDLMVSTITKVAVHPGNTVTPTAGTPNGVFGRWRYVAKYDVFMGVNSVYEPVFFFKLPE